jgi:hypothetical protein
VDEHQAQGLVRRRRSRAETEQVVSVYESSGLSQLEFCKQQGLSLATLARYRKQRRQQGEAATGNRWLAVEVSGVGAVVGSEVASGLAVALAGGRRIEVGRGFDAPTLVRLLGVLEGR